MSGTPSTRISQHRRLASPPRLPSLRVNPMAIPRAQEAVPPPLPPPTLIPSIAAGHDVGWQWGNSPDSADFGKSAFVKPGSSLLAGYVRGIRLDGGEKEHEYPLYHTLNDTRRGSSISTVTAARDSQEMQDGSLTLSDDDSTLSRPSSNHRLHGERQLEQRTLEASSNTYDKQLLSRIGGPNGVPNTPKRTSVSHAAGKMQETAQLAHSEAERGDNNLRPLSMPERRPSSLESPASSRWPSSGGVSPGFGGFWAEHGPPTRHHLQTRHGSLTFDDSSSHGANNDQSVFIADDVVMEDGHMSALNIRDRSPRATEDCCLLAARAGTKRRASSPPREGFREDHSSLSSASGHSDLSQRWPLPQLVNRGSPVSRFHPNHSSLSSASSFGPRHNSLGSSLGVSSIPSIPSSATSYASGRLSPSSTLSPAFDPVNHNKTLGANLATNTTHQRSLSESAQGCTPRTPAESSSHSRNSSVSHIQGVFICECCPKKPKKFETEEELRLHESEKQYTCAYCPNRFKNKNEAERHQNSLHLRKNSWSCAALAGPQAAFHRSTSGDGADACGYCGEEFSNPAQWDVREAHLNHVHKFGECNQAKKFFRADHFRQHLKHSHAGTSGKWTNMLEMACMKDEPLPEKRVNAGMASTPNGQPPPPALIISTSGAPASSQPGGGNVPSED